VLHNVAVRDEDSGEARIDYRFGHHHSDNHPPQLDPMSMKKPNPEIEFAIEVFVRGPDSAL